MSTCETRGIREVEPALVSETDPGTDPSDHILSPAVARDRCVLSPERLPAESQDFVSNASQELSSIMSPSILTTILGTSSNPASPGPSSPPLDQAKSSDFVPPTRPSSTPFPNSEPRDPLCCLVPGDDASEEIDEWTETDHTHMSESGQTSLARNLDSLPAEIHETILDHLFGVKVSTTSKSSVSLAGPCRSWGTALRHSRRKELSDLALVSRVWRDLIQSRLYRHIKLRATQRSLQPAAEWFLTRPHLQAYVKHLEIWFPVFQARSGVSMLATTLPTVTMDGLMNATYILPADNCSLYEVLAFVDMALPSLRILTLEGGDRKKAPKVRNHHGERSTLGPTLSSVQTLVTKGQWNLIRKDEDFFFIMSALPNLTEWHGAYNKPKSKSYLSMASVLPGLPSSLTRLNLCLEGDYRREIAPAPHYLKVCRKVHICTRLAEASPGLEHISYTGRVCKAFFDMACLAADPRRTRLKSIDLTVKNVCRPTTEYHDSASGIQDMKFIQCFESLVLAGIRSMEHLTKLQYLRIRFVDLDSIAPQLNPYFILQDGRCSGVWSEQILTELNRVRYDARFEELSETFGDLSLNKEGRLLITPGYSRAPIRSLRLSNYALIQQAVTIT